MTNVNLATMEYCVMRYVAIHVSLVTTVKYAVIDRPVTAARKRAKLVIT